MNPRVTTIVLGAVIFGLGLVALLFPQFVMDRILGFTVSPAHAANGVIGEVRATYGGIFVVMGLFTLIAALDPRAHRSQLVFTGALWLGACSGRLFSVYVDGAPGPMSWVGVAFESILGMSLIGVSYLKGGESSPSPAPVAVPSSGPSHFIPDEPVR